VDDPARQPAACTNLAYTTPRMTSKPCDPSVTVGQIIGEVMKQLDDDRCACTASALTGGFVSHRQGLFRTAIRRVTRGLLALPENKSKTGIRISPDMTTLPSCAFNHEKWTLWCKDELEIPGVPLSLVSVVSASECGRCICTMFFFFSQFTPVVVYRTIRSACGHISRGLNDLNV
jgi:hypothetical protein